MLPKRNLSKCQFILSWCFLNIFSPFDCLLLPSLCSNLHGTNLGLNISGTLNLMIPVTQNLIEFPVQYSQGKGTLSPVNLIVSVSYGLRALAYCDMTASSGIFFLKVRNTAELKIGKKIKRHFFLQLDFTCNPVHCLSYCHQRQ